ncbi:hypothetical protein BH20GEM1_BH20GEM1_13040 [soil metagenome]
MAYPLALLVALGCGGATQGGMDRPPDALAEGEELFSRAEYAGAAQAYEAHVSTRPDDSRNDRVLFRLGMLYLVHGAPERDAARGERNLRELSTRFPESPWRDEAEYLLSLRQEVARLEAQSAEDQQAIERLESQIEALKRIDLEGEP